jgi:hypothetical protein
MRISFYTIISGLFILLSCHQSKRKAEKIVAEWFGKEVKFSNEIKCLITDSLILCPDIRKENYKILLYVDSIGCMSCRLRLGEWKKIIERADTLFPEKPEFILIFQPKYGKDKEIKQQLKQNGFIYPVFIDVDDKTFILNNFPKEDKFQCFLLDRDNRVVLTGNPVFNPAIWELYKQIILKNEE